MMLRPGPSLPALPAAVILVIDRIVSGIFGYFCCKIFCIEDRVTPMLDFMNIYFRFLLYYIIYLTIIYYHVSEFDWLLNSKEHPAFFLGCSFIKGPFSPIIFVSFKKEWSVLPRLNHTLTQPFMVLITVRLRPLILYWGLRKTFCISIYF